MSLDNQPEMEDIECEDDADGYFLEPTTCAVNIAERIAEANRQLFEQIDSEDNADERPKKVQFSDKLLDYEPTQPDYCTEDTESISSNSEDEIPPQSLPESNTDENTETPDVDDPDEDVIMARESIIVKEPDKESEDQEPEDTGPSKLLLVLLPREQSSSCESVIGEEVDQQEEKEELDVPTEEKKEKEEPREKIEAKPRPKSANKGTKKGGKKQNCKLSKISPELDYSIDCEKRGWNETTRPRLRNGNKSVEEEVKVKQEVKVDVEKMEKKIIQIEADVNSSRPVSSNEGIRIRQLPVIRPRTAPTKRACCVEKTDLPRYNGFRSEYGLSAEQLGERKRKIAEVKRQRKLEKMSTHLKEAQRKQDNELKFSEWLEAKTHRSRSSSIGSSNSSKVDTLARSDIYIQRNAVYAKKCGVVYAVDYNIGKSKFAMSNVREKVISLKKLLGGLSPNDRKSYNICITP